MYIIESRNILTPQNGLNIYRGRTEDSIFLTEVPGGDPMDIGVKMDAPELLMGMLRNRRNKGIVLMGNMGDPYNSLEDKYKLTRECLKVIEACDYGVIISTKQKRIMRDIELLSSIASKTKCVVDITLPTLDDVRLHKLEGEETITAGERLKLIGELRKAGIDVIVTLYPVIPFVNDDIGEIREIVQSLHEYDILGLDIAELRVAIKKSVRGFFYTQFKKRFPDEYKRFCTEYTESGELLARDYRNKMSDVTELCKELDILCDTRRIKALKRQYENKTVGKQMSLFDVNYGIE